jgi:hypothetical protein
VVPVVSNDFHQDCVELRNGLMDKRIKRKNIAKPKKSKDLSSKTASDQEADGQNENPFDLGGLPQRDLKKNLGCG